MDPNANLEEQLRIAEKIIDADAQNKTEIGSKKTMDVKVGDWVEYELSGDYANHPRWDVGVDSSPTGEWRRARVDEIKELGFATWDEQESLHWWWGFDNLKYIRKVEKETEPCTPTNQHKCTCELYAMMRIGCKCGAMAAERR